MARVPVKSSDLSHVEYDRDAGTLRVWFHSGGTYEYHGVPESTHDGLMGAASKGKYFHRHIKHNDEYECKKLG